MGLAQFPGGNRKRLLALADEHGAGEGNRTPDLRFTKPLLYQLSYAGYPQTRKCSPGKSGHAPNLGVSISHREENRTADALRQLNSKGVY